MKLFLFTLVCAAPFLFANADVQQSLNDQWRNKVDTALELFKEKKINYDQIYNSNSDELTQNLSELLNISEERSSQIQTQYKNGELNLHSLESNRIEDIKRELKIIPVKWFALAQSKLLKITSYFNQGFSGLKFLIWDSFILICLFFTMLIIWKGIKNISQKLEEIKNDITRNHYRNNEKLRYAKIIKSINPYIPWLVSYIGLSFASNLVRSSSFSDFGKVIPFAQLFILYQIYKRIFINVFEYFIHSKNELTVGKQKTKAINSSAKLARTITFYSFVLYSINSVISKGISYLLFAEVFKIFILFIICLIAYRWREEVLRKTNSFQIPSLTSVAQKLLTGLPSVLFSAPFFIITFVLILANNAFNWLCRFEFIKKINAQLFKKRLSGNEELEEGETSKISTEYKDLFLKDETFFFPRSSLYHRICNEINEWIEDPSEENSIAFYGEKGIGKTTILNKIESDFQNLKTIRLDMTKRLTTSSDVFKFFGEQFGIEQAESAVPFINKFKKTEKTIIILDETHNMFLSKIGGFNAYKTFLELVNIQSDNIFWLASFNLHAWNFLTAITGQSNYFRLTLKVPHWTDKDIKKLIMMRHDKGEYKLSFSNLLQATRVNDDIDTEEYIEDQFFRLLWEQSNGIPKIALSQWLTSLSPRYKTLKVGLPQDDEVNILKKQSDNTLFVFAALIKHENLTAKELIQVTSIGEGIVRNSLKFGLESKLLRKIAGGKYTIAYEFQINIINYLKKKNFVYAT